jgi:HTH-type transcriptional regulator/antitoxin HipB
VDYAVKTLSQLRPILQGFRKAAGHTQTSMARQLGVTQQTYAELEANPASASVERLFKVLRLLDVEMTLTQIPNGPARLGDPAGIAAAPAPSVGRSKRIAPDDLSKAHSVQLIGHDESTSPDRRRTAKGSTESVGKKSSAKPGGQTRAKKGSVEAGAASGRVTRRMNTAAKKRENW